jgi:hypothetical protein
MYEVAAVEDLHDAVAQFNFDDDAVFSCIGTSGKEPVLSQSPVLEAAAESGGIVPGPKRGRSPTEPVAGAEGLSKDQMDPELFMSALKKFMTGMQPPPKQ